MENYCVFNNQLGDIFYKYVPTYETFTETFSDEQKNIFFKSWIFRGDLVNQIFSHYFFIPSLVPETTICE